MMNVGTPEMMKTLQDFVADMRREMSAAAEAVIRSMIIPRKLSASVGDGASTTITVTHNLNSRNAVVMVYRNGAPYDQVFPNVNMTTPNTVDLVFASAPAVNAYQVVIVG